MSSSCECPADDQACKHVAALLFGLWSFTDRHQDRHTAVGTDIACTWNRPKKAVTPQLLDEIDIRMKRSSPLVKPTIDKYKPILDIPDDLEKRWKHAAGEDSLAIRYLSGSSSSDSDTDDMTAPTFLELCRQHRNGGLETLASEFTQGICDAIEENTRGQANNQEWVNQRLGRITASVAHQVMHVQHLSQTHSLLKSILGQSNFSGNMHTQYGKERECVARSMYSEQTGKLHKNFKIWETGLIVVPDKPHLGASPDAMVECKCHGRGVIEIKCPSTGADCSLEEFANLKSNNISIDENKCVHLGSGPWMTQIQMQMALAKVEYCDFVLFLGKHPYIHVERIYHDQALWDVWHSKLTDLFMSWILPNIQRQSYF